MAAPARVGPNTLEDWAQLLCTAQERIWANEWAKRDVCRALLDTLPEYAREGWLKALQEVVGISHSSIIRWAEEAALVPPYDRAADKSPAWQIQQARKKDLEAQGAPKP